MAKRIGISKLEAQTGAAAELVALLQSDTEDGRVSTAEIRELHVWLGRNRDADLPGIELLSMTIESIAADGKVTDDERAELTKVIEKVLPPEFREIAKQRRRLAGIAKKEQEREVRLARAAAEELERERAEPVCHFDFVVAGVAFEGRAQNSAGLEPGTPVFLIRDRTNAFSRFAIEVRSQSGYSLGFVPEEDAREIAPLLDRNYSHIAYLKKLWQGDRFLIPIVIASLFRPDTTYPGVVQEAAVPPSRPTPALKQGGCAGALVFAGAGILLAVETTRVVLSVQ